jgi:hypothetical protein
MATTFRQDVVAALVVILRAQATATPTLLRKVWTSRPGTYNELPLAYIGPRDETITWDAGTRTRTMDGMTVIVVDNFVSDAGQVGDRMDELVDLLVDRFNTQTSAAVPSAIIELVGTTDTEVVVENTPAAPTYYRACILTFRNRKWEGRD